MNLADGRVRRPDGSVVELRRQSASVLGHLATRRGMVVPRCELFEAVWNPVVVTDDSLVQCVGDIRRALGPAREALQTVARHGYRLEAEAPPILSPAPVRSSRSPRAWLVPAAMAVAAISSVLFVASTLWPRGESPAIETARFNGPVVIVQPFENLGGGARWDLLARAITEDVTADLAQNAWLFVIGEATVRAYADASPPRLAAALGADYVVRGTIQAEAGEVHVAALLLEARTGRQSWSKRWTGKAANLLMLQREASEALTAELASSFSGPIAVAERRHARGRGTDDLTAYELAQLGMERAFDYTPEGLDAAIELLHRAVLLDPDFGEAWAYLSYCYATRILPDTDAKEARRLRDAGDAAALTALRVSPDRPKVLIQAGQVTVRHDRAAAERMFRRAAALASNDADNLAYVASMATQTPGLAVDAATWIERAMRLNPHHPDWYWWNQGNVLFALGRYAEAGGAYAKGPDFIDLHALAAASFALAHRDAEASAALARAREESPEFDTRWFLDALSWDPAIEAAVARGLASVDAGAIAHAGSAIPLDASEALDRER